MRLAILTVGLLTTALLAAPASARIWQKSWALAGHPIVHVASNDGHVRIHRGGAGAVHAKVEYKIKVWGWHSEPREPLVDLQQRGDVIMITAKERGSVVVFGGIVEDFTIDVDVPDECDLDIRTGDGGIDLEPVKGHISVETGDGHINADGLRGELRLVTGDGSITGEDLDGALEARTGDGHIQLSGRFDRINVRSGDGRVEVTARQGSQTASPWDLTSGDGSLTLRIPRDLKAMLDAAVGDGHMHVDLPVNVSGGLTRHTLRGALNGGTTPVRLRTVDGGLTLTLAP